MNRAGKVLAYNLQQQVYKMPFIKGLMLSFLLYLKVGQKYNNL